MSQDENKKVVANKSTTAIKDTKTKSSSTTKKIVLKRSLRRLKRWIQQLKLLLWV